jgi:hypothetical protein
MADGTRRVGHSEERCVTGAGTAAWLEGRHHQLDQWRWAHGYRQVADLLEVDEAVA